MVHHVGAHIRSLCQCIKTVLLDQRRCSLLQLPQVHADLSGVKHGAIAEFNMSSEISP